MTCRSTSEIIAGDVDSMWCLLSGSKTLDLFRGDSSAKFLLGQMGYLGQAWLKGQKADIYRHVHIFTHTYVIFFKDGLHISYFSI